MKQLRESYPEGVLLNTGLSVRIVWDFDDVHQVAGRGFGSSRGCPLQHPTAFQDLRKTKHFHLQLITEIETLNENPGVHGILVQLPLPAHLDEKTITDAVDYKKDVDGWVFFWWLQTLQKTVNSVTVLFCSESTQSTLALWLKRTANRCLLPALLAAAWSSSGARVSSII